MATSQPGMQKEVENIAIKLAVAAVKEKIPPEYAVKYVGLLLEESKHKKDSTAERHHQDTIHHTINDIVSQFEEKIVPSTENIVLDIKRELSALSLNKASYTSIYTYHENDEDRRAKDKNSFYAQCMKNFFDGGSFSGNIPLCNAARRHIISAESVTPIKKHYDYTKKSAQPEEAPASNGPRVAPKSQDSKSPTTASNGVKPREVAGKGVAEKPVATQPSKPDHQATPEKVETAASQITKQVSTPPVDTLKKAVAFKKPAVTLKADSPSPTPVANPPERNTSPREQGKPTAPNAKRHLDSGNSSTGNNTEQSNNRNSESNKKKSANEGGVFKSGMDYLVKRHAEGKAPMDIDLDKPKKALGLSYPSRGNANRTNVSYYSNANDSDHSQSPVPERYMSLLGADITPEMINMVLNMKLDVSLYNVMEEDIAGLDGVKKTLKDKVVQPILRPELHRGLLMAPKGVLLFGPPGTGKTTLAKWMANVSKANCFEVSPSSITSKFHGESESIIKTLFKVADLDHPSIIFIDEVDALLGKRGSNDADLSIRMKNQLLQMMDGLHCSGGNRVVVVIAATNRPTMLDDAALRRFGKRVLIPLPDLDTRQKFIHETLRKNCDGVCELSNEELKEVAVATEGWNGSDLLALCMKAAEYSYDDTVEAYGGIDKIPDAKAFRGIVMNDFRRALTLVHPSYSSKEETYFEDWNKQYGSH